MYNECRFVLSEQMRQHKYRHLSLQRVAVYNICNMHVRACILWVAHFTPYKNISLWSFSLSVFFTVTFSNFNIHSAVYTITKVYKIALKHLTKYYFFYSYATAWLVYAWRVELVVFSVCIWVHIYELSVIMCFGCSIWM